MLNHAKMMNMVNILPAKLQHVSIKVLYCPFGEIHFFIIIITLTLSL